MGYGSLLKLIGTWLEPKDPPATSSRLIPVSHVLATLLEVERRTMSRTDLKELYVVLPFLSGRKAVPLWLSL